MHENPHLFLERFQDAGYPVIPVSLFSPSSQFMTHNGKELQKVQTLKLARLQIFITYRPFAHFHAYWLGLICWSLTAYDCSALIGVHWVWRVSLFDVWAPERRGSALCILQVLQRKKNTFFMYVYPIHLRLSKFPIFHGLVPANINGE